MAAARTMRNMIANPHIGGRPDQGNEVLSVGRVSRRDIRANGNTRNTPPQMAASINNYTIQNESNGELGRQVMGRWTGVIGGFGAGCRKTTQVSRCIGRE